MTAATARRAIAGLTLLAIAVRCGAMLFHPPMHPDEFFQYLEPAWGHLHGYGWRSWEWNVGLRSWVLPGYHGAWMALWDMVGVKDTGFLLGFFRAHWAIASAAVVPAAWHAGRRLAIEKGVSPGEPAIVPGWEGGLLAATMCALLPVLLYYAPHTLSEVPSMIALVWGYAVWLKTREEADTRKADALVLGALLGAGVCLRVPNAPLAVVPAVDLLVRRRWRGAAWCALGGVGPLAFFAAVDWATWGVPLHSAIAYVRFNAGSGANDYGVAPWSDYLAGMRGVLGWTGVVVVAAPILAELRAVWRWLCGPLLLVAVLSATAHKEMRFMLAAWPLLAIAFGAAAGRIVARERRMVPRTCGWIVVGAATTALVVSDGLGLRTLRMYSGDDSWSLYRAQTWVGQQADLAGVLEPDFVVGGGWMMLGRNVPMENFDADLLGDPLFNYAIVREPSRDGVECQAHGFRRVWRLAGTTVWRR